MQHCTKRIAHLVVLSASNASGFTKIKYFLPRLCVAILFLFPRSVSKAYTGAFTPRSIRARPKCMKASRLHFQPRHRALLDAVTSNFDASALYFAATRTALPSCAANSRSTNKARITASTAPAAQVRYPAVQNHSSRAVAPPQCAARRHCSKLHDKSFCLQSVSATVIVNLLESTHACAYVVHKFVRSDSYKD
jgi:hypothetical protein